MLTVRDVGKVSALLSFQPRNNTTPARDLTSPLLLLPSLSSAAFVHFFVFLFLLRHRRTSPSSQHFLR